MKATIVRDGLALELETSNAAEMKEALSSFFPTNGSVKHTPVAEDSRVTSNNKNHKTHKPRSDGGWNVKTLGAMARIISENPNAQGNSKKAHAEITRLGDTRSMIATQVVFNRVKRFLTTGDKTALSAYMPGMLKQAGYKAKSLANVKTKKHGKGNSHSRWTERDILALADIIHRGMQSDEGFSGQCIKYVRTNGDTKNRSAASIYTTSSDMKLFLNGENPNRAPKKIRAVLQANGYPKTSFLPTARELVAQEA